ncbi:MAG: hypothetical protein WHS38_09110 [Thermodesulforhabdaceae bacterium]
MSIKDEQSKKSDVSSEPQESPEKKSKSSLVDQLDIEVDELTKTIEDRIDQLFRPEFELSFDFERKEEKDKSPISEIIESEDVESGQIEDVKRIEEIPEREARVDTADVYSKEEEPTLLELLEKAQITYLSLDWEFSQDNLKAMNDVVIAVESKVVPIAETRVLFTILKKLLEWFSYYEQTVSSSSLALFRETLQFLRKILQRDQKIGDKEREIINQLRKRFNILRKQHNIKEPDLEMPPVTPDVPEVPVGPKIAVVSEATEASPALYTPTKIASLEDLEREIQNLRKALEQENVRLRKVIEILYNRPKLKPLGDRLIKLVERYETCAFRMQNLESSLKLSEFAVATTPGPEIRVEPTSAEKLPLESSKVEHASLNLPAEEKVQERKIAIEEQPKKEVAPEPLVTQPTEIFGIVKKVYVFLYQGKYFAIPADQLIKYDQISSKKAASLINKGFGTLKDVKPFFKKITYGVRGGWLYKPEKDLKSMVFKYVNLRHLFRLPGVKEEYGGMIIFVSDGTNNVMFLVDSVIGEDPISVKDVKPANLSNLIGVVNTDQYKNVDVIDIRTLV